MFDIVFTLHDGNIICAYDVLAANIGLAISIYDFDNIESVTINKVIEG